VSHGFLQQSEVRFMSHDLGYVTKAGTGLFGAPGHSLCYLTVMIYAYLHLCVWKCKHCFRPLSDIILILVKILLDQQLDLYVINCY